MDVVVTIAQSAWPSWIAEGDLPGEAPTEEWALFFGTGAGRRKPVPPTDLHEGDRVYILAWGMIRGYAPLVRVQTTEHGFALVRGGGAVACTVVDRDGIVPCAGFQNVRYRWWKREDEAPFGAWETRGLPRALERQVRDVLALRQQSPALRQELKTRALAGRPLLRGVGGLPA